MDGFMLEILVPDNIWQMLVWYSLLVACVIITIVVQSKKRKSKRTTVLQGKIDALEEFALQIGHEKPMKKKELYAGLFTLNAIEDFCKQTFEESQFIVYDEAGKLLTSAMTDVRNLDLKKWKEDEQLNERNQIVEKCEKAIEYLSQAL